MRKKEKLWFHYFSSENLNFSVFPLLSSRRALGGGEAVGGILLLGHPKVHTENLFFQHKNLCALMLFCPLFEHSPTNVAPPRANPAPTKGSVTFLNEEINLLWHSPLLFSAFMVISFRKGGETICDSIRRGFYALIWFTNLFRNFFPLAAAVEYCAKMCARCCCWHKQSKNWILCETSESQHILRLLKICLFYVFNKSRKQSLLLLFPLLCLWCCSSLLVIFIFFVRHQTQKNVDGKFCKVSCMSHRYAHISRIEFSWEISAFRMLCHTNSGNVWC